MDFHLSKGPSGAGSRPESAIAGSRNIHIPTAISSDQIINKWLLTSPSLTEIETYLGSLADENNRLQIASYCAPLAEKLETLSRKGSGSSSKAGDLCRLYQRILFSEMDKIAFDKSKLSTEVSHKIIHACGWLRISHPILNFALEIFYQDRAKSRKLRAHADVELLQKLGKDSNVVSAGAAENYNLCLNLFRPVGPLDVSMVSLQIKRLYSLILAGDPKDSKLVRSVQSELKDLGAGINLAPNAPVQFAILWSFCNPAQPLPRFIEAALVRRQSDRRMGKGEVEITFAGNIISGIQAGVARLAFRKASAVERGINLPYSAGPFNVDFSLKVRTADQQQLHIAVELNGKQHYCLSARGETLVGHDRLKRLILKNHGVTIVDIPNRDLFGMKGSGVVKCIADKVVKNF